MGCPSSRDLGQREAGMGRFSALCLFEAGAITAVSGPYLNSDTEQTHTDTTGLRAYFCLSAFVCKRRRERACILCDSGERCVSVYNAQQK